MFKKVFFTVFVCILFVTFLNAQFKTVISVNTSTFKPAKVTMLNDSVFTAFVSVYSNAYAAGGYINHAVYLTQMPGNNDSMLAVNTLPILNHTNTRKIEFNDGTAAVFQKLKGCMANCYFFRKILAENDRILLTCFFTDDIRSLQTAQRIKQPYSVFLQMKPAEKEAVQDITYIPKIFTGKSKNQLAKYFKDYPELKTKIENETFANNIDGLLQLIDEFGKMKQ